MKHLLYEHQGHIFKLKADAEAALKQQQDVFAQQVRPGSLQAVLRGAGNCQSRFLSWGAVRRLGRCMRVGHARARAGQGRAVFGVGAAKPLAVALCGAAVLAPVQPTGR